jgi:MoaA/NifB/PqqE/SkfB family radical SAM enzyme
MEVGEVLRDFLTGKHTAGQMYNIVKYFLGRKNTIVNWEPIYISIFPTLRCNLSCDMCLTHSKKFENPFGQKPCQDMDFELFKKIVDRYKNALAVNLIGNGEPLLYKDLFRMIEYAARVRKMYTYSGSNGIVLGDYVEPIVDAPLKGFTVSLNGHNAAEYNRMTGMPGKNFDIIRDNTIKLVKRRNEKKSKVEMLGSIILDKENYRCLKDMVSFADSLGIDKVLFFQFLASPAPGFTPEERCLFDDDIDVVKTFAEIESMRKNVKVKISLPPLLAREMNGKSCSVPFYNITFDGEGNVGGCSCQILNVTGNKGLEEANTWNNAYFQEFRLRFLDPTSALLEPCRWCYNNVGRSRLVSSPNPLSHLFRQLVHRKKK